MSRRIVLGREARAGLIRGAKKVSKAAAVTYGPCGRTVLLERAAGSIATKDGATVVRELRFEDALEDLGAEVIKQPSLAMSEAVGDGTTTAAIIAGSLLDTCERLLVGGFAPVDLVRGVDKAMSEVLQFLEDTSAPVTTEEEIHAVAMVSSNHDEEVSDLLTKAVMAVGKDGSISIEDGRGVDCDLIIRDGMELDAGYISRLMVPEEGKSTLEQPLIALFDCGMSSYREFRSVAEEASQWPHPLLIVAHAFEAEALATWSVNSRTRSFDLHVIKTPGTGFRKRGWLDDLAALSGATVFDHKAGMDITEWDPEWFGSVQTVTIDSSRSLFCGYDDEETDVRVRSRLESLKTQRDTTESTWETDRLRERMARLDGGFCVLRVGGTTESETKERRARIEDTLGSLRAALESGIVPGGGTALNNAADWLDYLHQESPLEHPEERRGWGALAESLRTPLRVLCQNAGHEMADVSRRLVRAQGEAEEDLWVGWDALRDEVRLLYEGPMVVDATKVVSSAVKYAVSAVSTLVMTNAVVARKR